ncbi:MAG: nucleoside deaminase [Alistipes sp.]|uniref:nucleoside deaminase n=1 Tax=Alistipes sp. TaxID=1872444 RepID=UPI002A90EC2F|nr:nucleoside deaminase [Alistipes sp.]MDY5396577.1 nucleoside deaminase [Alistipes sp.]
MSYPKDEKSAVGASAAAAKDAGGAADAAAVADGQQQTDERFMRLALAEARKALDAGEVPIGAVVVSRGAVVGRGHNLVETLADPTAHAEMQALTAAASTLGGKYLPECTLYVTVEPCIMCAGAIAWAQVGRVVWGADDPKKGYRRYSEAVFHPRTTLAHGVLATECGALMTSFFAFLRK